MVRARVAEAKASDAHPYLRRKEVPVLGLFLGSGGLGFGNAGFQGLPLGSRHVLAGDAAPRPFLTCAPVLPPEGGRAIRMGNVRPIRTVRLVRDAAAIENAVRLDAVDRKPCLPQTVRELLEGIATHAHAHPHPPTNALPGKGSEGIVFPISPAFFLLPLPIQPGRGFLLAHG